MSYIHTTIYLSACPSIHLSLDVSIIIIITITCLSAYLYVYQSTYLSIWLPIIYISIPCWLLINMMVLGSWGNEGVSLAHWSPLHWLSAHAQVFCVMRTGLSWQASRSLSGLWKTDGRKAHKEIPHNFLSSGLPFLASHLLSYDSSLNIWSHLPA